ncbi:bifunctional diguanylate cyclase/phosphodiesterase [Devosia salina]|uniref:Bifunctional diguanylate cyclase/phosphodiesterase n=1 Tax=Devosia salina TaxID=2860336 RepID=A0ABX8WDW8_9HYPH|nr:bifunctional diguanylate cyclase/phosphodiesterase [Devosia salina]QYO75171.1 bifunctional diguanylate cyclase/phosphodiesterase [Devosia salina]
MTSLSFPNRLILLVFGLLIVLLSLVGGVGWWAVTRIDEGAQERQARALVRGLAEIEARIPIEQDSSAVWNDAVLNLTSGNQEWIADNLVDWMSSYFGHNRVYVLDPADNLVRAAHEGLVQPAQAYERDKPVVQPLVDELRRQIASLAPLGTDSTDAIAGSGILERMVLGDGAVGIVSVRPVVPDDSAELSQLSGSEYIHVSVRLIDQTVSAAISENYNLAGLRFDTDLAADPAKASLPVLSSGGQVLGYFSWDPFRPATQLVSDTAPTIALSAVSVFLVVIALLRRLSLTAARLRVSQAEAHFLAFHDPLTRVANRALFEERLQRAIVNSRRLQSPLALHAIDLDRFKAVNDGLGHPAGDELLRQVAGRVEKLVSEVDTVARLGGDEFSIVQVDIRSVEDALRLGRAILSALERPFDLNGQEVSISGSVGIVYSSDAKQDAVDLVRQADVALYEAKTSGRARYEVYAGELDQAVQQRRALEHELRHALNASEGLELVYQPIFEARSGALLGCEALVRWNHPTKGRMPPDAFISLAEERGLINQLGLWVLRRAAEYVRASEVPWVAVNVSPVQFQNQDFAASVLNVLDEVGLSPRRLELEITEGLLLQNSEHVQQTLRHLRASGIRVALDDFGTGYSSISYLRTYGVDKLKIDKSFVSQLGRDDEIDGIVKSIIDLARAMRMKVTAEGVETQEQRVMLENLGCGELQGYLLSRPLTPERLIGLCIPQALGKKVG